MSYADRQKRYRDGKRNAPGMESVTRTVTRRANGVTRVTDSMERNAPKVTPQDAPQSTNGEQVVAEHPRIAAMIANMSDAELLRRLHYIQDWQQSPEHKEVMRRRVA